MNCEVCREPIDGPGVRNDVGQLVCTAITLYCRPMRQTYLEAMVEHGLLMRRAIGFSSALSGQELAQWELP